MTRRHVVEEGLETARLARRCQGFRLSVVISQRGKCGVCHLIIGLASADGWLASDRSFAVEMKLEGVVDVGSPLNRTGAWATASAPMIAVGGIAPALSQ